MFIALFVAQMFNSSLEYQYADTYTDIRVFKPAMEESPVPVVDLLKVAEPWSVAGKGRELQKSILPH